MVVRDWNREEHSQIEFLSNIPSIHLLFPTLLIQVLEQRETRSFLLPHPDMGEENYLKKLQ